jgi:pimeloyl-ACP methyl ester carboxylesterase
VPDPLAPGDEVVQRLAAHFAPDYRVVSISPRPGQPYQIQMTDVLAIVDQFGFDQPILVGEGLGCVAALLLAAWHPGRIARLVLIDATFAALSRWESAEARALRDCPPDWPSIRAAVQCPIAEVRWDAATADDLMQYLQIP